MIKQILKMKNLLLSLAFIGGLSQAQAQLDIPVPSPKASVSQMFGLTDIRLEYASPAVKGRIIFGELVPYGQVWRTGANSATEIHFSTDVELGGKEIKAGKYALFTIPNEKEWTIILNTNEGQWGSTNYKQELDVHRFTVAPKTLGDSYERLVFLVQAIDDNSAHVLLRWANTEIAIPVKANTDKYAQANIAKYSKNYYGNWYAMMNAAKYQLEKNTYLKEAQKMAEESIRLKEHFTNRWVLAQILAKNGDTKGAIVQAQAAKDFGTKNPSGWYDDYKAEIEKALSTWQPAKKK
jgi:hypothetical protein